jgi:hypothetical protein
MQREPVFVAQCRRHAKGRLAHTHEQQPQRFACVKDAEVGPNFLTNKKCYNSKTKKTKLNFECTIKFVSINPLKQDLAWIYLDKIYINDVWGP